MNCIIYSIILFKRPSLIFKRKFWRSLEALVSLFQLQTLPLLPGELTCRMYQESPRNARQNTSNLYKLNYSTTSCPNMYECWGSVADKRWRQEAVCRLSLEHKKRSNESHESSRSGSDNPAVALMAGNYNPISYYPAMLCLLYA